jgi:diphthine-ammonia ligase
MSCRTPDLLEGRFRDLFHGLDVESKFENSSFSREFSARSMSVSILKTSNLSRLEKTQDGTVYWTISSPRTEPSSTISNEAEQVISVIKQRLAASTLEPSNIISTIITLRSMEDFAAINKVPYLPTTIHFHYQLTYHRSMVHFSRNQIHHPESPSPAAPQCQKT